MLYAENYKLYAYNDINDFNLVKDYLERCAIYKSEATIITSKYCLKSFYVFYISYLKSNGIECEEYLIKSINIKTIETYIISLLNKKLSNNINIFNLYDIIKIIFIRVFYDFKKN